MSTSTVALTIEMPSLDASLSWNALESLVVGMSHEVPARALALALDDAQERLLQEACGPRWAPVLGLLAPFACPGCGAREDFARKGKRTRPRKLHTAAGTVELILWHVGCRGCGRNFAPLLVILGLSGKRRTDRLSRDRASWARRCSSPGRAAWTPSWPGPPPRRGRPTTPWPTSVSYTHLRAHETPEHLVCRLLLEKKKKTKKNNPSSTHTYRNKPITIPTNHTT